MMKLKAVFLFIGVISVFWAEAETSCGVTISIGSRENVEIDGNTTGLLGQKGELEAIQRRMDTLESKFESLLQNFGRLKNALPKTSCDEAARQGFTTDGTYTILLNEIPTEVYCEFDDNGGSWLVFQRRFNGDVSFEVGWSAYETGIGDVNGEFWLGLEKLHRITSSGSYKLRVDMEDWEGNTAYAEYSTMTVGNAGSNYRLTVGDYSGTAGDSLSYHNNQQFTTHDRDHDNNGGNCASDLHGGWWFNYCHRVNLNGRYFTGGTSSSEGQGLNWYAWRGFYISLKKTTMKLQLQGS